MRRLLLAVLVAAPALIPGMAMAAPGDPLPGNPPLSIPAQPDALYPVISRCYDLAPAGNLPRRACYQFVSATGLIIRDADGDPDGQTFIYPPENGGLTPPVIPDTPARAPYTPPGLSEPIPQVATQPAPGYIPPIAHATPTTEVLAAGPTETANGKPMASRDDPLGCVANAVRGMPGFDPNLDPDQDGVSCEQASNLPMAEPAEQRDPIGTGLFIAAIVLAIAALAIGFLPRRARHRAE